MSEREEQGQMNEPLPTVEELDAMLERCEKATQGPWCWEQYGEKINAFSVGVACFEDGSPVSGRLPEDETIVDTLFFKQEIGSHESCVVNYDDAEFIAHSREDLPRVIRALKSVMVERDSFKAVAEKMFKQVQARDKECFELKIELDQWRP